MNDWPPWAKLAFGPGFAIAVALWLIFEHSGQVYRLATALESHSMAAEAHFQEAHIQTILLRQICRNGAKTELGSQFCEYGLPNWERR